MDGWTPKLNDKVRFTKEAMAVLDGVRRGVATNGAVGEIVELGVNVGQVNVYFKGAGTYNCRIAHLEPVAAEPEAVLKPSPFMAVEIGDTVRVKPEVKDKWPQHMVNTYRGVGKVTTVFPTKIEVRFEGGMMIGDFADFLLAIKRSRDEIEALKENWKRDPCWDIETTEGFEAYADELLAYHKSEDAAWKDYQKKQALKNGDYFAEYIGKADPAFGADTLRDLVDPLVDPEWGGYVNVNSARWTQLESDVNESLVGAPVKEGKEAAAQEMMNTLLAKVRAKFPEFTTGGVFDFEYQHGHWIGFVMCRQFTEADLLRGDHFRLEVFSGGNVAAQAKFERDVSAQMNKGWEVLSVQPYAGDVTVALVK